MRTVSYGSSFFPHDLRPARVTHGTDLKLGSKRYVREVELAMNRSLPSVNVFLII